jgi:pimeloyl-ACP methyl ester carboxylesterase
MRTPQARSVDVSGAALCVWDWEAPPDAPTAVFFHATGFHGRVWDAVIRHLDGVRCVAVDARGHGASDKPPPPYSWQLCGQDAAAVVEALNLRCAVGVGHSIGGNSVTRAAAALPDRFAALLLVDPVIFPRSFYNLDDYSIDGHFVLNRRVEWESPQAMIERFSQRDPFKTWHPDALRDYAEYGLLADGDRFRLACSPTLEAHTYLSGRLKANADIYDLLPRVTVPVRILRAANGIAETAQDLSRSATAPDLAAHFPRGEDLIVPNSTHFIPMEQPETVAWHIRDLIERTRV